MKTITSTLFFLVIQICFAQIVNIPDPNFKAALLAHDPVIDTNSDGEIQISEAEAVSASLNVSEKDISNLTGIEAFVNLTQLYCHKNQLSHLDLSQNPALTHVVAWTNQLNSIDVSNSPNLWELSVSENNLSSIDVTQNTQLMYLFLGYNPIAEIDLSQNVNLRNFTSVSNQFTSLDLSSSPLLESLTLMSLENIRYVNIQNGNNAALTMYFDYGPNLECIRVDSDVIGAIPDTWHYPAGATFSDTCTMGIDEVSISQPSIYPNPVRDQFNIKHDENIVSVEIYALSGQKIMQVNEPNISTVHVQQLAKGTYIVRILSKSGKVFTQKIIIN